MMLQTTPLAHHHKPYHAKPAHAVVAANQQALNPIKFGADPTGHNNSTDAFNKCVAYAISNSISNINITPGSYIINQSGIDDSQRPYGVTITNANGLNIKGTGKVTILTDITAEPTPVNALRIYNSTGVNISFINFKGTGTNRPDRGKLYTGAGVYTEGSKNIEVSNCRFESTFYAVCAFRSSMLNIHDNVFINGNYDSYNCMPKSAILLYSTADTKVVNNTIYGSLVDGDLSLFGLHTDNCLITGNKLYGYAYNDPQKRIKRLAQGITIDQGPKNNTIQNNIVYGYFYGIDIKAATFNNIIKYNTVQYCKVGIAERKGEALKVSASANNTVSNNTIIMGGAWNNNYKMYGLYQSVGILSENRSDINCTGNTIEMKDGLSQNGPVAGIAVKQDPRDNTVGNMAMHISNNAINLGGTGSGIVPDNSDAIYISNIKNSTDISKNTIQIAHNNNAFKVDGIISNLTMNGNKLPQLTDRGNVFKMMGAAKINSLNMSNNTDKKGVFDKQLIH